MTLEELSKKIESLPNEAQLLLLKAALYPDQKAIIAWKAWSDAVDYENTDGDSYRLYPLVYQNLTSLGVPTSPVLERFKGVYRYYWSNANHLFHKTKTVLAALLDGGVPILLLKGVPLASSYYKMLATRPFQDIDLLIPYEKGRLALQILEQHGFFTTEAVFLKSKSRHAISFKNKHGIQIDLHICLMAYNLQPQAQKTYWEQAENFSFQSLNVLTLCPTDHLFHAIVHSLYNNSSLLRWVADACMIMEKRSIDWNRLVFLAQHNQVSVAIAIALAYLQQHFIPSIPTWVIDVLNSSANNRTLQEKELIVISKEIEGLKHRLLLHWLGYLRAKSNQPNQRLNLFRYFQKRWGLSSVFAIPFYLAQKI